MMFARYQMAGQPGKLLLRFPCTAHPWLARKTAPAFSVYRPSMDIKKKAPDDSGAAGENPRNMVFGFQSCMCLPTTHKCDSITSPLRMTVRSDCLRLSGDISGPMTAAFVPKLADFAVKARRCFVMSSRLSVISLSCWQLPRKNAAI